MVGNAKDNPEILRAGARYLEHRVFRIYLAGPMRGLPELNFPKFNEVANKLRAAGHAVFNPAENAPRIPSTADGLDDFSYWMAIDLSEVCKAEAIVMLPGWEASKGARLELHTARECGKQVFIWSWLQTQEELLCESSH